VMPIWVSWAISSGSLTANGLTLSPRASCSPIWPKEMRVIRGLNVSKNGSPKSMGS
jgi:hypothetical protein